MEESKLAIRNEEFNATIEAFEKIKSLADYLATSDTFTKGFELKDKDNNPIIDEVTNKPKINTTDIALCLMTGRSLGLDIPGSLLLGKKLNPGTYLAVLKGQALGLDIATSMEKIVSIPTQNGLMTYTMVDVISAKLLTGGIKFLPFIKNYAPFHLYYHATTNDELDLDVILDEEDNLLDKYFVVDSTITSEILKSKLAEGKIPVKRVRQGFYSKAKFIRTNKDGNTVTHYQRFSTVDAQRAGLLPIYDDKNVELQKGKNNWITNTPQMMNNRVISIGGRIIAADLLHGIYTYDEVVDAGLIKPDKSTVDTSYTDVSNTE